VSEPAKMKTVTAVMSQKVIDGAGSSCLDCVVAETIKPLLKEGVWIEVWPRQFFLNKEDGLACEGIWNRTISQIIHDWDTGVEVKPCVLAFKVRMEVYREFFLQPRKASKAGESAERA
jgi:hypothetical protein